MTRITSFGLYECPTCHQTHIKPEYGSISHLVPSDIVIEPSEIIVCKGCGKEFPFKDFKFMGLRSKRNTKPPTKVETWIRKVLDKPYEELDVRKIYPKFK